MSREKHEDCNSSKALITKINGKKITLHVEQGEDCDACAAAALCEKTSSKGKTIEIPQNNAEDFSIGEKVMLNVPQSKTYKALGIAFLYPLILVIATCLIGFYSLNWNDGILSLVSLAILAAYYLILYRFRHTKFFNFSLYISKA